MCHTSLYLSCKVISSVHVSSLHVVLILIDILYGWNEMFYHSVIAILIWSSTLNSTNGHVTHLH